MIVLYTCYEEEMVRNFWRECGKPNWQKKKKSLIKNMLLLYAKANTQKSLSLELNFQFGWILFENYSSS